MCVCCRWEAVPMHLGQLREEICPFRRAGTPPAHSHGWEALPVPALCQTLHAQWPPDQARTSSPRFPPIHDRTQGARLTPGSRIIHQHTVSVNQQHPLHNLNPVAHLYIAIQPHFFKHIIYQVLTTLESPRLTFLRVQLCGWAGHLPQHNNPGAIVSSNMIDEWCQTCCKDSTCHRAIPCSKPLLPQAQQATPSRQLSYFKMAAHNAAQSSLSDSSVVSESLF